MSVGSFFSKAGRFFKSFFKTVSKIVTPEQLAFAKALVTEASDKALDNATAREWVVSQMAARFPLLPESIIRWVVETIVVSIKHEIDVVL